MSEMSASGRRDARVTGYERMRNLSSIMAAASAKVKDERKHLRAIECFSDSLTIPKQRSTEPQTTQKKTNEFQAACKREEKNSPNHWQ